MNPAVSHKHYVPSGECHFGKLALAIVPLLVLCCVLALVASVALNRGLYICVLVAAGMGAALATAVTMTVRLTHCRNRMIAAVLAMSCGAMSYLGYYHVDQCLRWQRPWTSIESLPHYISFRVATDTLKFHPKAVTVEPMPSAVGVVPHRPLVHRAWLSWLGVQFWLELAMTMTVPLAALAWAGRPYSEQRGCWHRHERLILKPEWIQSLRDALAESQLQSWLDAGPEKATEYQDHGKVCIWYVPRDGAGAIEEEIYLSINQGPKWLLAPCEAACLVALLPSLQNVTGAGLERLAAEAQDTDTFDSARVWQLPPHEAGRSQNAWSCWWRRWLLWGLVCLPSLLVVAALPGGVHVLGLVGAPEWLYPAYVVTMGLIVVIMIRLYMNAQHSVPVAILQWLDHDSIRRAICRHTQRIVEPDDADAIFAEMLPRQFWHGETRAKPHEYNSGLLKLDVEQRALLFEGDNARYWIPAEAVLECQLERMQIGAATTSSFYAVVLLTRLGSGL